MKTYTEFIDAARLIPNVTSALTTGDAGYPGTALEISDNDGNELFHIVVNSAGELQVLFLAQDAHYRLPLNLLERILAVAKEKVGKAG